jgi:hypothetical protein
LGALRGGRATRVGLPALYGNLTAAAFWREDYSDYTATAFWREDYGDLTSVAFWRED